MSVRVIAGCARGIPLKAPKGMHTRPTSDRIKEALFNIIGPRVIDSVFLDLFAGTGGIGIEALSRGASNAFFIEKDTKALDIIKNNLLNTKLEDFGEVYRTDMEVMLHNLGNEGRKFDIIFLDPPYLQEYEERVLHKISMYSLLNARGIVIVESSKRTVLPEVVQNLKLYRQKRYGDTLLTFYSL